MPASAVTMVAAAERAGRVVGRRRAAERGGFIGQAFVRGRLLRGWEDAGVGGKLYPDSGILRRHHESTTHNHGDVGSGPESLCCWCRNGKLAMQKISTNIHFDIANLVFSMIFVVSVKSTRFLCYYVLELSSSHHMLLTVSLPLGRVWTNPLLFIPKSK
jgi:hypothetical protein